MGKWKRQMEIAKEHKEKRKKAHDVLGKFFFDLAKLVFATVVLAAVVTLIKGETKNQDWMLLSFGLIVTYTFVQVGYNILKR